MEVMLYNYSVTYYISMGINYRIFSRIAMTSGEIFAVPAAINRKMLFCVAVRVSMRVTMFLMAFGSRRWLSVGYR